jgi:hypothetical protein
MKRPSRTFIGITRQQASAMRSGSCGAIAYFCSQTTSVFRSLKHLVLHCRTDWFRHSTYVTRASVSLTEYMHVHPSSARGDDPLSTALSSVSDRLDLQSHKTLPARTSPGFTVPSPWAETSLWQCIPCEGIWSFSTRLT